MDTPTSATTLRAREAVALGTLAFQLDKPAGFAFEAGQAIDLVLADAPADATTRHAFSIASAPYEEHLTIATRMRDSPFKRALGALPLGAPLRIDGPFGSLALHREFDRAAVLIAGGIGITPFRAMLRQAAHDQRAQRIVLLYSNRRPEDAPFLAELQALEARYRHFTLVATMTAMSRSDQPWSAARGPIDETLIAHATATLARPVYYVVGPPAMAESLTMTLAEMGVADADIRGESFYGY